MKGALATCNPLSGSRGSRIVKDNLLEFDLKEVIRCIVPSAKEPSALLVRSLIVTVRPQSVPQIGAGALRESRYHLEVEQLVLLCEKHRLLLTKELIEKTE
jgi:hypothetical protein